MGLSASPLRRRGCLLALAFIVLIPFTVFLLIIGPGKYIFFLFYNNFSGLDKVEPNNQLYMYFETYLVNLSIISEVWRIEKKN